MFQNDTLGFLKMGDPQNHSFQHKWSNDLDYFGTPIKKPPIDQLIINANRLLCSACDSSLRRKTPRQPSEFPCFWMSETSSSGMIDGGSGNSLNKIQLVSG